MARRRWEAPGARGRMTIIGVSDDRRQRRQKQSRWNFIIFRQPSLSLPPPPRPIPRIFEILTCPSSHLTTPLSLSRPHTHALSPPRPPLSLSPGRTSSSAVWDALDFACVSVKDEGLLVLAHIAASSVLRPPRGNHHLLGKIFT